VSVTVMSPALASAEWDERARLVVGAVVVRRDPSDEVGLGLGRDHLDDVGQVLALGGELDVLAGNDLANRDPPGHPGALGFELGVAAERPSCQEVWNQTELVVVSCPAPDIGCARLARMNPRIRPSAAPRSPR